MLVRTAGHSFLASGILGLLVGAALVSVGSQAAAVELLRSGTILAGVGAICVSVAALAMVIHDVASPNG